MNKNTFIIIGIIVVVVLLGATLTKKNVNTKTTEIEVGYRGYAAVNRLLAAQRYLESYGEKVKAQRNLRSVQTMPGTHDTLFLSKHGEDMSQQKTNRLLNWVNNGGRLIAGPDTTTKKNKGKTRRYLDNILFNELGIKQIHNGKSGTKQLTYFDKNFKISLNFRNDIRFIYQGNRQYESLKDPKDNNGALILRIFYGKGVIILISDISMFFNKQLATQDHAILLNYMTLPRISTKYWFLYGKNLPTLFDIITDYLWPTLIGLTIIIALWLISSFRRFGPIITEAGTRRRSLLEHIDASARLFWSHGEKQCLVEAVRNKLYQRIELRYPTWIQAGEEVLIENLAKATSIHEDKVRFAIKDPGTKNEQDFTQLITNLEQLRKAL